MPKLSLSILSCPCWFLHPIHGILATALGTRDDESCPNRSGALPLLVNLNFICPGSHLALEALIPHSHRWERATLSIISDSNSDLARVRTRLDSLKYLSLYFGGTTGTVDFCQVAPRLTEIELEEIHEPVTIKLPWEQLEICTLDNAEITHYVLQHAKNLRVLHLSTYYGTPHLMSMPRNPHSYYQGLSTLNMWWRRSAPGIQLFSSITLPSLQTLKICFGFFGFDKGMDNIRRANVEAGRAEVVPVLAGFFERSCAHLSTLTLTDIPFSQSGLIRCLELAPSLVSLDIQFDGECHGIRTTNEELLRRLNVGHPNHILLRLHSLSLRGPGMIPEELLDSLIASRRDIDPTNDGVALLENLTLERPIRHDWVKIQLPFQRFVSGGLNFTYREYLHAF
ncbi:hypothetical protein BD779DRAFT_1473882 [Infundibulicybe gibba]|nr:hypothetical protein BD779DRAFT_1473882 [Infundibulicybe gibba]